MTRPMWKPPRFAQMFTVDVLTTVLSLVGGVFVALFLLGWISP